MVYLNSCVLEINSWPNNQLPFYPLLWKWDYMDAIMQELLLVGSRYHYTWNCNPTCIVKDPKLTLLWFCVLSSHLTSIVPPGKQLGYSKYESMPYLSHVCSQCVQENYHVFLIRNISSQRVFETQWHEQFMYLM